MASAYGVTSNTLGRRHAGVRAAGDVAHGIAARLARRHARVGQQAHRRLDVVQLDEMKLDVLPRRDVAEVPRVLLADLGQREELLAREHALRHLHAQHLRVRRLPLSVGAAHEAKRAPLVGRDLAALVLVRAWRRTRRYRPRWQTTAARVRACLDDRLQTLLFPLGRLPGHAKIERGHGADHERGGTAALEVSRLDPPVPRAYRATRARLPSTRRRRRRRECRETSLVRRARRRAPRARPCPSARRSSPLAHGGRRWPRQTPRRRVR